MFSWSQFASLMVGRAAGQVKLKLFWGKHPQFPVFAKVGFVFWRSLVPLSPHPTLPWVSLCSALMFFVSGISRAEVVVCVASPVFPGSTRTVCAQTIQCCLDTSDMLQSHLPGMQNMGCRCDQLLSAGCVSCIGASNSQYICCFLEALNLPCRAV